MIERVPIRHASVPAKRAAPSPALPRPTSSEQDGPILQKQIPRDVQRKECANVYSQAKHRQSEAAAPIEMWPAWVRAEPAADPPAFPARQREFQPGNDGSCHCPRDREGNECARSMFSRKV